MILTKIFFSFLITQQFPINAADPQLEWKTKTTKHFYIHYESGSEEIASRTAKIAEPIYRRLTQKLRWEPSSPVHVVLNTTSLNANGLSTPIPYNAIYLDVATPDEGSSLDEYDDWLTILLTHEFTHTVHIDMVGGVNRFLRAIFGRTIVPNAAEPQWIIEGLAEYNETTETTGGRGRSSFVKMHLRTDTMQDKFLAIDRATYWNQEYPFGNAAYWYGVGFMDYLSKRFGEEKLVDFLHSNAEWPIIGWFNIKTRNIFGTSFSRLWSEWRLEEKKKWQTQAAQYQSHYRGQNLASDDKLAGQPVWHPNKNLVYLVTSKDDKTRLEEIQFDNDKTPQRKTIKKDFSARNLSFSNDYLYYSKSKSTSHFSSSRDIWRLNLKTNDEEQLTSGKQLLDPYVGRNYIYAVQSFKMKERVVRFPAPVVTADKKLEVNYFSDPELEVLFEASGFGSLSSPVLSPDRKSLVFTYFEEGRSRDLYLLDIPSRSVERLTQDHYLEYFPRFSDNGNWVYFSSDRELGTTKERVFNIYALHLRSKRLVQVTDSWTGVYWPALKDTQLFVGNYSPEGFRPQYLSWELPTSMNQATAPTLTKENIPERVPPISAGQSDEKDEVTTSGYKMGSSLWPHYLAPIWFATEDDAAVGVFTGSNDPLGFHRWGAFGAHLFSPNRPIGSLGYTYTGLSPVSLQMFSSAGITDYGSIAVYELPSSSYGFGVADYFERNYYASLGLSWQPFYDKQINIGLNAFVEDRRPLLDLPADLITQDSQLPSSLADRAGAILAPQKGRFLGGNLRLGWSSGVEQGVYDFSPSKGTSIVLDSEYAPKFAFSDFNQLTTVLSLRTYRELWFKHNIGLRLIGGNQWKDVLYQKTFALGGSFGQSPFSQTNRRSYPLRGLESGELRAEGLVLANFEYRLPLVSKLPGFGTAPIWFKNLHAAAFSDLGQVFQYQGTKTMIFTQPQELKWNRFTMSTGLELGSDISNFYGPPLTYRLGYAYLLYRVGDNVASEQMDQIYFQVGQSF